MQIDAIPAFTDNYIWLLSHDGEAVVVDPGDAAPVERTLRERGLRLRAILVTHHHPDHVGGIDRLLQEQHVPVYGPAAEAARVGSISHPLQDGDRVDLLGASFEVLAVPGHTLGHIAYYAPGQPGLLFCGDTLFSAGCGRLFEGTPEQMRASLDRLAGLPPDTRVYCTHEYTLSNLAFARAVEPGNRALAQHLEHVESLRAQQRPSLPSTLQLEREINPFLRVQEPMVAAAVRRWADAHGGPADPFAALRRWKDGFRG